MPLKESAACFQLFLNDAGIMPKKHKNILGRADLKVLKLKSSFFSFIHCIFDFNHEVSCIFVVFLAICLVDACSQAQIYVCSSRNCYS